MKIFEKAVKKINQILENPIDSAEYKNQPEKQHKTENKSLTFSRATSIDRNKEIVPTYNDDDEWNSVYDSPKGMRARNDERDIVETAIKYKGNCLQSTRKQIFQKTLGVMKNYNSKKSAKNSDWIPYWVKNRDDIKERMEYIVQNLHDKDQKERATHQYKNVCNPHVVIGPMDRSKSHSLWRKTMKLNESDPNFYISGNDLALWCTAAEGNEIHQHKLGKLFTYGKRFIKDYSTAAAFFEEAIKRGNEEARFDLAKLYEQGGHGITRNIKFAMSLYKFCAKEGNEEAMAIVKMHYNNTKTKEKEDIDNSFMRQ